MRSPWILFLTAVALPLLLGLGCAGTRKPPVQEADVTERLAAEIESLKERETVDLKARQDVEKLREELESIKSELDRKMEYLNNENANLGNRIALLMDQMKRIEQKIDMLSAGRQEKVKRGAFRPSSYEIKASYEAALKDYYDGKYDQAVGEFTEIIMISPKSDLADNAQYWIGECYYAMENYRHALGEFQKVFSYPGTDKDDDAQLKIAYCYMKMGDRERAIEEFRKFLSDFPTSEFVPLARGKLRELGEM